MEANVGGVLICRICKKQFKQKKADKPTAVFEAWRKHYDKEHRLEYTPEDARYTWGC